MADSDSIRSASLPDTLNRKTVAGIRVRYKSGWRPTARSSGYPLPKKSE